MRTILLLSISLSLLLASCKSIEKMVEKGDYDGAIAFAAEKLQGKENKKTKYVRGLERAFAKITSRDMANYQRLLAENRDENWDRIYNILTRIDSRQAVISPLLPLVSNEGYEATFRFVKLGPLMTEAKQKATDYHYAKGLKLIEDARIGDKDAARQAYHEFASIGRYYQDHKDARTLSDEALFLGKNRIHVTLENSSFEYLPLGFEHELFGFSASELNTMWTEFHFNPHSELPMDYVALLDIVRIDVSRDNQDQNVFIENKKIEDGKTYVLDDNGNVKKDSLGNDISVPKFVDIRARVIELRRAKEARVETELRVIDLVSNELIDRNRFYEIVNFEDYSCTVAGDRRALSNNARNKYKSNPLPFPSDGEMLLDAAVKMKSDIRNKLRRSFI